MVTQLEIAKDNRSTPAYIIPIAEDSYTARLAADTDTTVAVPTDATRAILSSDDYFFVKADGAITLPSEGAGFSKTGAVVAFDAINVVDVTTLHLRAQNACDVSVSFYN